ncbi:ankyrin repeat domain-containing protein [Aspergillus affinis]|uniref:ankyrin repeat domain-containing protein n=1 Tax=Aspergillus affinis TaxID=1070780 RepID=UPI0022FDBD1C|nr:uncharacterized protein KD926_007701 [Aspergillus affinis]KAI9040758.1 hypothetical protein KD926_007701 [Aspergillus affinis]
MERNVKLELPDETGMTPLLWAAVWEHEEIASMLLERGVDPNCDNENLRTPLSFAAENGQNSLVSLLLEKGALPNKGAEESPLIYAVTDPYSDDYSIVELPPLVLAASHGNEEMMNLFLKRDADSDKVKKDYIWMALVEACREGKDGVVKLLLDQRPFDGLEGDNVDDGPFYYAKLWGHGEIVELSRPYCPHYESE